MNRGLYTILVIAISVGITLAFVAACHKKCACNDDGRERDAAAMQTSGDDMTGTEGSGNSGSRASSKDHSSGGTDNGNAGNSQQDEPRRKYGDAETGGNVYTIGGVPPGPENSGTVTNTSGSGTTNGGNSGAAGPETQKTQKGGTRKN